MVVRHEFGFGGATLATCSMMPSSELQTNRVLAFPASFPHPYGTSATTIAIYRLCSLNAKGNPQFTWSMWGSNPRPWHLNTNILVPRSTD
ncbi:hypothetical protein O181_045844 [Austropuccinia psidii MF-1]|uniref:Uncharacterized protein n=1 Tax=Austropuccinia psidii MF-1 TaxID=1389203 RepID=A0A9Q3DMZ2_9BASI|nr:hypothetical protein [Austropuccinia psidii MF-1]